MQMSSIETTTAHLLTDEEFEKRINAAKPFFAIIDLYNHFGSFEHRINPHHYDITLPIGLLAPETKTIEDMGRHETFRLPRNFIWRFRQFGYHAYLRHNIRWGLSSYDLIVEPL